MRVDRAHREHFPQPSVPRHARVSLLGTTAIEAVSFLLWEGRRVHKVRTGQHRVQRTSLNACSAHLEPLVPLLQLPPSICASPVHRERIAASLEHLAPTSASHVVWGPLPMALDPPPVSCALGGRMVLQVRPVLSHSALRVMLGRMLQRRALLRAPPVTQACSKIKQAKYDVNRVLPVHQQTTAWGIVIARRAPTGSSRITQGRHRARCVQLAPISLTKGQRVACSATAAWLPCPSPSTTAIAS